MVVHFIVYVPFYRRVYWHYFAPDVSSGTELSVDKSQKQSKTHLSRLLHLASKVKCRKLGMRRG